MPNGLERVRPAAMPAACSHAAWHELLQLINSKPTYVLVRKDYLDEVMACHLRVTGDVYRWTTCREKGRKYYSIDRAELFGFVQVHGKACGHGV